MILWRIQDTFEMLVGYTRILFFAVYVRLQGYRVKLHRSRFYSAHLGWYPSLQISITTKNGGYVAVYDECMFRLFTVKHMLKDALGENSNAAKATKA
jgi:hypothetical protein